MRKPDDILRIADVPFSSWKLRELRELPGGGPIPWRMVGGKVAYKLADVQAFLASLNKGGVATT